MRLFSHYNYKINIVVFGLMLLISSCTKDNNTSPDTASPQTEQKITNASYGSYDRNKMDVYLPENRDNNTPFVLLIHGGSWVSGNKSDMAAIQDSLLIRGIASASINYRYASGTVHYEELMDDVSNALSYCLTMADEWSIRKDKYVLGGVSAGAHMSLLYAHRFNTQHSVAAVISAAGPTDLTDVDWLNYTAIIGQLTNIQSMVGAQYYLGQPLDARFSAASPVKDVKDIPTLMIHGDNDLVVAYTQSQKMAAAMDNVGFNHKLVTIPGANHDLGISNPATASQIINEITLWVNTYGR